MNGENDRHVVRRPLGVVDAFRTVVGVVLFATNVGKSDWLSVYLTVVSATVLPVTLAARWWGLAVLDAEGVRSRWRRRLLVRWDDVQGVSAAVHEGAAHVVVHRRDGEPFVLPQPLGSEDAWGQHTRHDRWFWQQYHLVGQRWQRRAGRAPLDGVPLPRALTAPAIGDPRSPTTPPTVAVAVAVGTRAPDQPAGSWSTPYGRIPR
ncbi:MAG: hypothetical protein U0Q15_10050 [Kineosporiaceae bacterium]